MNNLDRVVRDEMDEVDHWWRSLPWRTRLRLRVRFWWQARRWRVKRAKGQRR
jgi:hypothetical protein